MFQVNETHSCLERDGKSYYSMKEVANILNQKKQFGRNKLFRLLRDNNIIWGSGNVYPEYRNTFFFEEAQTNGYNPYKTMIFTALRVSEDGIKLIERIIENKLSKTQF